MRFGSFFLFLLGSSFIFLKYPNLFKWQTFRTQQSMLSISFIMLRLDSITAFISHTYFTQSWSAIFTADLSMQTLEYMTEVRLPCMSFSVNTESILGIGLKSIVDIHVFVIMSVFSWLDIIPYFIISEQHKQINYLIQARS